MTTQSDAELNITLKFQLAWIEHLDGMSYIFLRFELHYVDVRCWVGLGHEWLHKSGMGLGWVGSAKSWVGLQKMDLRPCLGDI